jgi:hypothetical protein
LLGQGNIGAKLIFPKYLFWAYIGVLKVKSDFSTYFSKESSNPKNIFVHNFETKIFNFKAKHFSNKSLNQKSASHELLIQLWRIQKKIQLLGQS